MEDTRDDAREMETQEVVADTDADTRDDIDATRIMFDDIIRRIDALSNDIDAKLEAVTSKMAGISVASGAVIRDAADDADDDEPTLDIESMDLDI